MLKVNFTPCLEDDGGKYTKTPEELENDMKIIREKCLSLKDSVFKNKLTNQLLQLEELVSNMKF